MISTKLNCNIVNLITNLIKLTPLFTLAFLFWPSSLSSYPYVTEFHLNYWILTSANKIIPRQQERHSTAPYKKSSFKFVSVSISTSVHLPPVVPSQSFFIFIFTKITLQIQ